MKLFKTSILASTLLAAASASAVEVSGNVTLTTDYSFRGVTQTDNKGAIQGGFDLGTESGAYAGIWASNVNFGTDTSTEMDYYFGWAGDISEGVSIDVGYIYFDYEGDAEFDYQEFAVSVGFSNFTLGVNYSDEYLGDGGPEFFYPYAEYSLSLPSDFALDFHVGLTDLDEEGLFEAGEDSYTDWSVTLSKSISGVDFALAYVDTTIDDLFGSGSDEGADGRVIFSISKSL